MAKANISTVVPELKPKEPNIDSLSIDFGLRFDKKEIPDYELRRLINSVHRKLNAINAISIVLHNHEIELRGNSTENYPLDANVSEGLFDAIKELSGDGYIESENLGLQVMKIGGAK
jgi:hypothetical protein